MKKKKMRYSESNLKSEMIKEDMNAFANMPQERILKAYPEYYAGDFADLYDTLSGIDKQMNADVSGMKRNMSKSKM